MLTMMLKKRRQTIKLSPMKSRKLSLLFKKMLLSKVLKLRRKLKLFKKKKRLKFRKKNKTRLKLSRKSSKLKMMLSLIL